MKKKNWIRGLDRIALLTAIPAAIFGTYYCSKDYTESKAVSVYLTNDEEEQLDLIYKTKLQPTISDYVEARQIFDYPNSNGIVANGEEELQQQALKHPFGKQVLDRAFYQGGDPKGTLVENGRFGLSYGPADELSLIPPKSERYAIGALGAIVFSMTLILGVGLSTRIISRVIQWLKDGFQYPSTASEATKEEMER